MFFEFISTTILTLHATVFLFVFCSKSTLIHIQHQIIYLSNKYFLKCFKETVAKSANNYVASIVSESRQLTDVLYTKVVYYIT